MKKIELYLVCVGFRTVGAGFTNTQVLAAEIDTQQSTTAVEIEAGGNEQNPIIDGVQPGTGHTGSLVIDTVSNFNFGKVKLGVTTQNAIPVEGETLGAQVTDVRGTGAGWSLMASITEFSNSDETKKLKAQLTIPSGKVKGTDANSLTPAIASGATLNESPSKILYAEQNSGMGTWSNAFEGNSGKVNLLIPTDSYIDSYSAIINWSLQDAPA